MRQEKGRPGRRRTLAATRREGETEGPGRKGQGSRHVGGGEGARRQGEPRRVAGDVDACAAASAAFPPHPVMRRSLPLLPAAGGRGRLDLDMPVRADAEDLLGEQEGREQQKRPDDGRHPASCAHEVHDTPATGVRNLHAGFPGSGPRPAPSTKRTERERYMSGRR